MSQVHAPYHFVPLSKWVYMPNWAHLVSHDVPFKDGYSGKIAFTLTNATPLLVGDKQVENKGEPTKVLWAKDPQGNPIIPGSSLKGMIRNVLEIATFSKFSAIDDSHFSYRDISSGKSKYADKVMDSESQAYWLKFDNELRRWTLRKANHTVLFHDEFNQHTGCEIKQSYYDLKERKERKPAVEDKYKQWPLTNSAINFDIADRKIESTKGKEVSVARATNLGKGTFSGFPVFSGFRPGKKIYTSTRLNFSYMFYGSAAKASAFDDGDILANKLFANHTPALVNYLKEHAHPEYGIPVFSREKNSKILALGFAKMPRILYEHSVQQTAQHSQKAMNSVSYFDMAELMLGCLRDSGFGLKSRVNFADATCISNKGIYDSRPVILGQPKASYLSAYLEQTAATNATSRVTGSTDLSQYEKNSILSGWKRYPAQSHFNESLPCNLAGKVNVQSQLELIKPESEFKGNIVFHNLKPAELGALLWSLQLGQGDDNELYYHGLGHGKSLGAGAVQVKVTHLHAQCNFKEGPQLDSAAFVSQFVDSMNTAYPNNHVAWSDSPQVRHLLAFANKQDNEGKDLNYMKLKPDNKEDRSTTYTSSVQGSEKQVLPHWKEQGEVLPRSEQVNTNVDLAESFGQGRLFDLLTQLETKGDLTTFETQALTKVKAQQRQAEFARLSPIEQAFIQLKDRLAPFANVDTAQAKEGRQSCNADIEKLLDDCLVKTVEGDFMQEFYDICIDTKRSAYLDLAKNKKNKPKLEARKAKLAELAELASKYDLQ